MDIKEQIKKLPQRPGVYFFLDKNRKIIYIGKAANLKSRVSSHFSGPFLDIKTENKIKNTEKIDYTECESEIEALFLESELIKRYKPRYNVEWKDEKNFLYINIKKSEVPEIKLTRRPIKEPNTISYGPYTDSKAVRRALKILSRILPVKYSTRGALKPGFLWHEEIIREIASEIRVMKKIQLFFKGKVKKLIKEFENEMKKASGKKQYEKAALFRDRIKSLTHLKDSAIFRKEESEKMRGDVAIFELKKELKLKRVPQTIEAFDISNIFGKEAVGSMVTFKNGIPDQSNYRHFKIRTIKGIDDYKMMEEILKRRYGKDKIMPDLVLIDGGKGHLSTALGVIKHADVRAIAKKKEEIFLFNKKNKRFEKIELKEDSLSILLLQRIRDEAHRFAIIYHRLLRGKTGRFSELDKIAGIGEKTKKKLIKEFRTIENIKKASYAKLQKIIGGKLSKKIKESFYSKGSVLPKPEFKSIGTPK